MPKGLRSKPCPKCKSPATRCKCMRAEELKRLAAAGRISPDEVPIPAAKERVPAPRSLVVARSARSFSVPELIQQGDAIEAELRRRRATTVAELDLIDAALERRRTPPNEVAPSPCPGRSVG